MTMKLKPRGTEHRPLLKFKRKAASEPGVLHTFSIKSWIDSVFGLGTVQPLSQVSSSAAAGKWL